MLMDAMNILCHLLQLVYFLSVQFQGRMAFDTYRNVATFAHGDMREDTSVELLEGPTLREAFLGWKSFSDEDTIN